jgi:5'-nucleotidase
MLTILHTNDLHGNLAVLPRLAALIARERARDPHALLLDAGDFGLGGAAADLGVQLLGALGYDAIVPGNAENDIAEHRTAFARIGVPVVAANLGGGAGDYPARPYLLRSVAGRRIAILGLTTPPAYQATTVYPASHPFQRSPAEATPVDDPLGAAQRWVPWLRRRFDLVIVLSHLGLWHDLRLAAQVPGIDLIVGGHSHHRLPRLIHVGGTVIAQAGVAGAYLGVITIAEWGGRYHCCGRLEPVWQVVEPDAGMQRHMRTSVERHVPDALDVIGHTQGCWADPWEENPWANFVTDSLRAFAETDICLYKASMLIPALDPGSVTAWDLAQSLPISAELGDAIRMQLTGAAIHAILEHSVVGLPRDVDPRIAPEFSLPCNTFLHSSGIVVRFDLRRPEGQRVRALSIGGKPIDRGRRYSVVTSDFLARGYSGFSWFRDGITQEHLGPVRQLIAQALRACRRLPNIDQRMVMIGGIRCGRSTVR